MPNALHIIESLKRTRNVVETAIENQCSAQHVRFVRKTHADLLPNEALHLPRALPTNSQRRYKVAKTIDDLPPKAQEIALYKQENPTASTLKIAKALGVNRHYVYAVAHRIKREIENAKK